MFRQDDIIVEIKRHRETLNAHYRGRAIGMATCLIGSQNYGVDTLDSDIDSLGIFVPAFYSLATNASCEWEKSFPYSLGIARTMSHFSFIKKLRTPNITTLEPLYSKVISVGPEYSDLWKELVDARQAIAFVRPKQMYDATMGYIGAMEKELYKQTGKNFDKKLGYNPKALYHLARACQFLEHYLDREICYECGPDILSMKKGELSKFEVDEFVESTITGSTVRNHPEWFAEMVPSAMVKADYDEWLYKCGKRMVKLNEDFDSQC